MKQTKKKKKKKIPKKVQEHRYGKKHYIFLEFQTII